MPGELGAAPRVLVTVGTDHHHFTRLMTWIERWQADGPALNWTVQHGFTPPPAAAPGIEATAMLPHGELQAALRQSAVVVCQGGPGSIMDARGAGRIPIVVPRRPELGEHVDDHQVRFSRRLDEAGLIRAASTEHDFRLLLTAALERPERFAARPEISELPETVRRFGALVDELMVRPARRPLLSLRRRGQAS
ncbi:glycosyltransferase [Streptomyces specialis]|uniref:glycosyltransferase n=1 Tax=Streptomyces specialis TaxID=498367 RepID=UPI000B33ED73|nr:glycosyltransferase [Streptomyces specialis]